VVPYTRGRETSRPAEEIREEVAALAEEGVKEVILLGQNVNAYGRDLYGKSEFASLLHELAESYPGLWIRFLTSHPRDFGDDIVEVVAEHHNICRYIHLPLQAGSDRILEAMNRGYSRSYYLERVESIRARIPGCAISTDIIVGFPGESEEDFAQTLEAVEQCKFDLAYTYIYNRREGTPAAVMEGEVPRQVKMERFNRLADLVKRLARESNAREVGRKMKILVEGRERKGKENWLRGRASNGKVVHFEGGEELIGTLVQVRITRAGNWSLTGEKIGGK
jgi:tRNA-2-methylthio-N6-dimethylallyladenosine synthase